MNILYLLIPLSIAVATLFLAAFVWAVRSGQYEDTTTPSMRLLMEQDTLDNEQNRRNQKHQAIDEK